ncbi:hypothetical protein GWI33_017927 [Rhynchophorus ferrugineus]|uniref:Uncharacterized protein n=1 Tax=Rhynchophorus ferrugineus TaxID=354439 RepID=A0A834HVT5_RHYFE|nr:hypothetical protein GWI33_017927 [Rhynchophorus ferrugineus]
MISKPIEIWYTGIVKMQTDEYGAKDTYRNCANQTYFLLYSLLWAGPIGRDFVISINRDDRRTFSSNPINWKDLRPARHWRKNNS